MRQTERQGEEMKPEFKYCGSHEKHRPDPRVLEFVGKILLDVENRIERVTAVVEHEDCEDKYRITFASEGKVFVVIFYNPREITCSVREVISDSRKTIELPFEFGEKMRTMINFSYVFLIKQRFYQIKHVLEELNK